MQVDKNSNNNTNFGLNITTETVRRANRSLIERSKTAKRQGLTLLEYDNLHRRDYVHRIGTKIFDFYAISEKITSNKEKLIKAFSDTWKKIVCRKSC